MNEKTLPYTSQIIAKIIKEIEQSTIEPIISLTNTEFIAGAEYTKKDIIKRIKEINF